MKQINSGYNGNHKSMFILPLGDIHFGNRYYNKNALQVALDFANKHRKRTRIILMGDILEVATKTSVGRSVYDERYPTQKQFEVAIEKLKPYADMIDLIIEGNHEERIIRDTSFEIVQELAHRIGRFDAYGKFSGIVNYTLGTGRTYSVFAWHGASNGTTESSVINSMLKMRELVVAHIYLMGHTHKLMSFNKEVWLPNPNSKEPVNMEQLFVNTGTALGYGGYGEQKGLPRVTPGFGVIEIFADEHKKIFHKLNSLVI